MTSFRLQTNQTNLVKLENIKDSLFKVDKISQDPDINQKKVGLG